MVPLGGQEGRFPSAPCCCHVGPGQAAISSLTKVLSHLHLLESGLDPFRLMPPLPRRLPGCDCSLAKGSEHLLSPWNYHQPWVYLWMFYFSTWQQVLYASVHTQH